MGIRSASKIIAINRGDLCREPNRIAREDFVCGKEIAPMHGLLDDTQPQNGGDVDNEGPHNPGEYGSSVKRGNKFSTRDGE